MAHGHVFLQALPFHSVPSQVTSIPYSSVTRCRYTRRIWYCSYQGLGLTSILQLCYDNFPCLISAPNGVIITMNIHEGFYFNATYSLHFSESNLFPCFSTRQWGGSIFFTNNQHKKKIPKPQAQDF